MDIEPGLQVSSISTSGLKSGEALLGAIFGMGGMLPIPSMAASQPGKVDRVSNPRLEYCRKLRRVGLVKVVMSLSPLHLCCSSSDKFEWKLSEDRIHWSL